MRIDDYVVVGEVGRGAMGTVFLAHAPDGRQVAVKTLPRMDAASAQRMCREVSALQRIRHHAVVPIYDVGQTADGRPFLVMEYLGGGSLLDVLNVHGALSPGAAAAVMCDLAQALTALHASGVVHRDVKPSNVVLRHDGSPCLTDLGIALVAGASRLTASGDMIGTVGYTAPEAQDGAPPGPAMDVFSLGVMGYHLLAGRPPFGGDSVVAVIRACARGDYIPLAAVRPGLPPTLTAALELAMSHDPGMRPVDLPAWASEIRRTVPFEQAPTAPSTAVPVNEKLDLTIVRRAHHVLPRPGQDQGPPPSRRSRRIAVLVASAVLVAVIASLTAAWAWIGGHEPVEGTADAADVPVAERTGPPSYVDPTGAGLPAPGSAEGAATTVPPQPATSTPEGSAGTDQSVASSQPTQPHAGAPSGRTSLLTPSASIPKGTTTTQARNPADFNGDGDIDAQDLRLLCDHYGQSGSDLPSDVNKDGTVNIVDLSILLTAWTGGPSEGQCN